MGRPPTKKSENVSQPEDDSEFAEELAKRVSAIVPKGQQAAVVAQVMTLVQEERFSGPIAHPRHLREYEQILPGSADRIIRMAEGNLRHAQEMQCKALQADIDDAKAGRLYGFIALISLIVAAAVTGWAGQKELSLSLVGVGALGTITAFIKGAGYRFRTKA